MNNQNKQPSKINKVLKVVLISVLMIILLVLMVNYLNKKKLGEKINQTTFETMLTENKISDIYIQGGTVKIRKTDSTINEKSFPEISDYYFTYSTTEEVLWIKQLVYAHNSDSTVTKKVNFETKVQGESFISKFLPYLSIICVVVIAFLIFRTMSGSSKSAFTFGKSKTKTGEKSKVKFDDVAGANEEKAELEEIVDFLKNPERYKKLGARIPKGVLLVGPPGTGKTLLAKAVAGEINVPFFSVSGSDFVEMFVGVGASRVRDLFDTAKKNAPCIVFIDEIDAVGRKRGSGLGGGNDEKEQTLNQLLVEMDGFEANEGIIVLAATNRADVLDNAILRPGRFDRQIYVAPPDVKGRESIIKIHAKNKPLDENINYKTLARLTTGFTGADIENMLNEAALLAARKGRNKIIMTDITEGINKAMMGPQKKSRVMTENDRKITAYHESGHAILGKKLQNTDDVQEVSIIPRGMAGGYTLSRPKDDDGYTTYGKLMDEIAMTMGGRIAEELIFGDITTGASSDIQHATRLARKMVTEFGMSDKIGFVGLEGSNNELFLGRDYQNVKTYSEQKAKEVDDAVKEILDKNYKKAKRILAENKDILDEMATLLLEKETIYTDEVNKLMKGESAKKIAKEMEEIEKKQQEEEAKLKKESQKEETKNVDNEKLTTAQALAKAGIISQEELEKIINESKLTNEQSENQAKTEETTKSKAEQPEIENTKTERPDSEITKKTTEKKVITVISTDPAREKISETVKKANQSLADKKENATVSNESKKRGRPPKQTTTQPSNENKTAEGENKEKQQTETQGKKGRGRPPKNNN